MNQPKLPIPEPIRGREPDTWANETNTIRLPDIVRRVIAENNLAPDNVAALQTLIAELPDGAIRPLTDTTAWNPYTTPHTGQSWQDVPWFFAETYFYRRILEATGYFATGQDPFAYQKQQGLEISQLAIRELSRQATFWLAQPEQWAAGLRHWLLVALWGNRADLSLWPADAEGATADLHQEQSHILADDRTAVIHHLTNRQHTQVDIIADNAGFELIGDLALADYLLHTKTAESVTFHLKIHPTFVSDAIIRDVTHTITQLANQADPDIRALGRRLSVAVENGRLRLRHHPFWTSPLDMWQMPADLRQELAPSALIISKGDANYRRLLADRHWPYTTPFADIVSYMPAPALALRTLKAELTAGLTPAQIEQLNKEDEAWLINGRWGVIQFVK